MLLRRYRLLLLLAVVLLCGKPVYALDRVTLRNGFSYDCVRQQALDPEHTRLFLPAEGADSYVDIPTTAIVAVDSLPPPPSTPMPQQLAASLATADVLTLLTAAGVTHNIDAALLASIVHAESSGRAHAVSHTGARGLMQLMPGTARDLGVRDSFEPEQNINGGTAYFDALLTRYHNSLALALAAYNAGPAAVDRYRGIPPFRETQAYVARVMTEFKRRKQALEHKPAETLQAAR